MQRLLVIIFGISFFFVQPIYSAMSGGSFEIYADSVNVLDSSIGTGGAYTLYSTGGEFFATTTSGGVLELRGGFQAMERADLSVSLSATTLSLGTLSLTSVSSASLTLSASTTALTGYTIYASEDGNLRGSGGAIDDVSDGTVSAGTEEYGIRTSGGDGILTTDTAISGSVAAVSTSTVASGHQTAVIFSASIGNSSVAGTYSHIVTFSITANP